MFPDVPSICEYVAAYKPFESIGLQESFKVDDLHFCHGSLFGSVLASKTASHPSAQSAHSPRLQHPSHPLHRASALALAMALTAGLQTAMTLALSLPEVLEQIVQRSCEDIWSHKVINRKAHLLRWRAVSKLWREICDAYLFATVSYAYHRDRLWHWGTRLLLERIRKERPECTQAIRSLTVLWDPTWTSAYPGGLQPLQIIPTWLPLCSGLGELVVHSTGALHDLAKLHAQQPLHLPNLHTLQADICVANETLDTFLNSLQGLRTFRVMFDLWKPDRLGSATRRIQRLLQPVAGRITHLDLNLSSCTGGKSADILFAFQDLSRLVRLTIWILIPAILDYLPPSVEVLEIRCCTPTVKAMMQAMSDQRTPIYLKRAPIIREIPDSKYMFEPKVTRALVDKAIEGLARKANVRISEQDRRIWYRTVNAADD